MIILKSHQEIALMRRAGRIVAGALAVAREHVRPGVTTAQLNALVEDYILAQGAKPSFKGLYGFPAAACISVNQEVVHGIPGPRVLLEGDIVSVDVGAQVEGYHGDGADTFPVGEIDPERQRLIQVARESFEQTLAVARKPYRLSDISNAVQRHVEASGFSVVRAMCGHGIGKNVHEDPEIPNFGRPGHGPRLEAGMVLAIEPMINQGNWAIRSLEDGWTQVTSDGSCSAHYENTVLITDGEPEILTRL